MSGENGFGWRNAKSPGLRLVISLVEQLQDAVELDHSKGIAFKIIVKEKEYINDTIPFFFDHDTSPLELCIYGTLI